MVFLPHLINNNALLDLIESKRTTDSTPFGKLFYFCFDAYQAIISTNSLQQEEIVMANTLEEDPNQHLFFTHKPPPKDTTSSDSLALNRR
jgi:hypothetical protein